MEYHITQHSFMDYGDDNNNNHNNNDESKKLNRETRTTALLLTIVLCFLVIELPQGILVTCIHLIDQFEENVYQHLGDLLDFLTLLNESISFIIYTTMSYQFRQTFCHIFCPFFINKSIIYHEQPTINTIQYRQQYRIQNKITKQHTLCIPKENIMICDFNEKNKVIMNE